VFAYPRLNTTALGHCCVGRYWNVFVMSVQSCPAYRPTIFGWNLRAANTNIPYCLYALHAVNSGIGAASHSVRPVSELECQDLQSHNPCNTSWHSASLGATYTWELLSFSDIRRCKICAEITVLQVTLWIAFLIWFVSTAIESVKPFLSGSDKGNKLRETSGCHGCKC
jgi:hypothetical protein